MSYFIIIRGPLACGKSTIAKMLAKIIGAEYIPIDRVLDEYNLTGDMEEGYISQKSFRKANEIVAPKAKEKLQKGKPIVFDGNFYWKSQVDDLINRLPFPHHVFTLKAPVEVCIDRDIQRGKTHGEDAARAVHKKATEFDYGIVIDITGSADEAVKEIISHISQTEQHLRTRPKKTYLPLELQKSLKAKAINLIKSKLLPDSKILKIVLIGSSLKGSFGEYEPPGFRGSLFSDFDFIVFVDDDYNIPGWLDREPDGKPFPDDKLNLAYRNKRMIDDKYDVEVFFIRKSNMNNTVIQKQGEEAGIPMTENTKHEHMIIYSKENEIDKT